MAIQALLEEVTGHYIRAGLYSLDDFNPGLTREEIDSKIAPLGISLPEEVYELYMWKNGFKEFDDGHYIWPRVSFYSIDDSIGEYQIRSEFYTDLFPLFLRNNCDPILIKLIKDEFFSMLFFHCPPVTLTEFPLTIYDSLEKCLASELECFEKGLYRLGDDDFEEKQDLEPIHKKNNPNSEYWKMEY